MEGSVPHASSRKRCADLPGSVPLGQISNHTVAKDLVTIQQALLRATPGRAGCLASLLGPILPVRARMAGDLTAHHRGATPNQVGDTHLGQARIHPRHDRRAILDSKHPTTPHDQPPNSITATRKLLTPYDTANVWNTHRRMTWDSAERMRARSTGTTVRRLKPQGTTGGRQHLWALAGVVDASRGGCVARKDEALPIGRSLMCAGLDLGVRTVAESMRNLGLAGLNTHQRQSKRGGLSPSDP